MRQGGRDGAGRAGKLFTRFERVAPVKHFGGLGLGLYIAKELVSANGGSIEVESALGQGACFVVRLPVASS